MKSRLSVKLIATGMAEILVDGDISQFDISSNYIREQLARHDLKPGDMVKFKINSIGGNTGEGFSIYEQMQELKKMGIVVATYAEGIAASMGGVLLVGGTKGHRKMSATSLLMVHNPQTGVHGEEKDLERSIEILKKIKEIAVDVYTKDNDKLGREEIIKLMDDVTWMTAREALENGFIDEVDGESDSSMEGLQGNDLHMAAMSVFMSAASLEHSIPKQHQKSNSKFLMKELIAKALGLDATMADEAFNAALSQKVASLMAAAEELKTVKTQLATLQENDTEAKKTAFESMLSSAVEAKKITQAQADSYMKLGHASMEGVKEILDGIEVPGSKTITGSLQHSGAQGGDADRANWTLKEWSANDREGLKTMMHSDPEAYQALIKKTFAKKPASEEAK